MYGDVKMVKVTNIMGDEYSGKVDKAGVFAKWKGRQYRRKYVIPPNPRTTKQTTVRNHFTNAVHLWHAWNSLQKAAYGYLASGKVMSGFNLLVSRYQKAAIGGQTLPQDPEQGYRQYSSDDTAVTGEALTNGAAEHVCANKPLKLSSLTFNVGTGSVDLNAYIEIDRGIVRIAKNLTGQLTISYESGGRVITDEVLGTDLTADTEVRVKYWPIDYKTVTLKLAGVEVDGLEIDLKNGKCYFTNTAPDTADETIDYTYYTALSDVKLEVKKTDTSFVTFRGYSDDDGIIKLALTIEDQNYDAVMERTGYTSVILANRAAAVIAKDEYTKMTSA